MRAEHAAHSIIYNRLEQEHAGNQSSNDGSKCRVWHDRTGSRITRRSRSAGRAGGRGRRTRRAGSSLDGARGGSQVGRGSAVGGLDAGIGTSFVGVFVGGGRVVVDNLDGLDIHGEGTSSVVSFTTSPLNGTLAVVRVTTSPDADLDTHGSLRVILAVQGIGILQSADNLAVQNPLNAAGRPIDSIGVEGLFGGRHIHGSVAVVRSGVALTEVVGLDIVVISTNLLLFSKLEMIKFGYVTKWYKAHPVNLVQVIRFQHGGADDTRAVGSSHLNLDPAEEDVEVTLNGGSIALLGDGELGTKGGALDSSRSGVPFAE